MNHTDLLYLLKLLNRFLIILSNLDKEFSLNKNDI